MSGEPTTPEKKEVKEEVKVNLETRDFKKEIHQVGNYSVLSYSCTGRQTYCPIKFIGAVLRENPDVLVICNLRHDNAFHAGILEHYQVRTYGGFAFFVNKDIRIVGERSHEVREIPDDAAEDVFHHYVDVELDNNGQAEIHRLLAVYHPQDRRLGEERITQNILNRVRYALRVEGIQFTHICGSISFRTGFVYNAFPNYTFIFPDEFAPSFDNHDRPCQTEAEAPAEQNNRPTRGTLYTNHNGTTMTVKPYHPKQFYPDFGSYDQNGPAVILFHINTNRSVKQEVNVGQDAPSTSQVHALTDDVAQLSTSEKREVKEDPKDD